MAIKIRVYGKSQNRTALGIINAYLILYPHATQDDLNKAFPPDLNQPAINATKLTHLLVTAKEKEARATRSDNFKVTIEDDPIVLQDGTKLFFILLWQKPEFEKIIEWAKQYDIEVADFKPTEGFEKGGYRLEYLNGFIPAAPAPAKKNKMLLWLLIALALIVLLLLLLFLLKPRTEVVKEVVVEKVVVDTVYVEQQIDEIERNFNAARFEKGTAELTPETKLVLQDLAKVMQTEANLKLRIVGHSSIEGDAAFNQQLSEKRAKAAVDFLVNEENISADRLQYEGKGSSEPIDPNNNDANRRTEFIVIK